MSFNFKGWACPEKVDTKKWCNYNREERMSTWRKYTAEFKREAVKLSDDREGSVAEVARELGIQPNLLYRWRQEQKIEGAAAYPGEGNIKASEKELYELKKELDLWFTNPDLRLAWG